MQNRRDFLNIRQRAHSTAEGYWVHVSREAMACRFEVTLPTCEHNGVPAAREALDEIDRMEGQLTVFNESSEVSDINRNAAKGPVKVEAALFELLWLSRKLSEDTRGAFDITSGPLTRCWGTFRRAGSC